MIILLKVRIVMVYMDLLNRILLTIHFWLIAKLNSYMVLIFYKKNSRNLGVYH